MKTNRKAPCILCSIFALTTVGAGACGDGATASLVNTPAGTFTLSAPPAPVQILQGGGGQLQVAIKRAGGYRGSVALAVSGAPVGLTASIDPGSTTGTIASSRGERNLTLESVDRYSFRHFGREHFDDDSSRQRRLVRHKDAAHPPATELSLEDVSRRERRLQLLSKKVRQLTHLRGE